MPNGIKLIIGHKDWVLCVAWSPDAQVIATGSKDSTLRLWDPDTGKPKGDALRGHSKWITALAWEPLHLYLLSDISLITG